MTGPRVPPAVMIHFHGGGYCVGSAREALSWAGHLSAAAQCLVVLPEYRLAPEHPHPAALGDARAVVTALAAEAGPGSIVLSPWLDLGRDRRADPDLLRRDVLLDPGWLDACARAYAVAQAA